MRNSKSTCQKWKDGVPETTRLVDYLIMWSMKQPSCLQDEIEDS